MARSTLLKAFPQESGTMNPHRAHYARARERFHGKALDLADAYARAGVGHDCLPSAAK
jgi:hypothetical protein